MCFAAAAIPLSHELRTPNEGINQRNLKFWADVHMLRPYLKIWNLDLIFRLCIEGVFLTGRP